MMNLFSNPEQLSQYRNEMEKQAIDQAQEFLRRYGITVNNPGNPSQQPSTPRSAPAMPSNSGDLVTIPVSSLEHAENAPVDAFRTFIYPNFNASEIYIKKTGDDGKASFQTYLPKGAEMGKAFEDMMKKIMGTMGYIDERMKALEEKIEKLSVKEKRKEKEMEAQDD